MCGCGDVSVVCGWCTFATEDRTAVLGEEVRPAVVVDVTFAVSIVPT